MRLKLATGNGEIGQKWELRSFGSHRDELPVDGLEVRCGDRVEFFGVANQQSEVAQTVDASRYAGGKFIKDGESFLGEELLDGTGRAQPVGDIGRGFGAPERAEETLHIETFFQLR